MAVSTCSHDGACFACRAKHGSGVAAGQRENPTAEHALTARLEVTTLRLPVGAAPKGDVSPKWPRMIRVLSEPNLWAKPDSHIGDGLVRLWSTASHEFINVLHAFRYFQRHINVSLLGCFGEPLGIIEERLFGSGAQVYGRKPGKIRI